MKVTVSFGEDEMHIKYRWRYSVHEKNKDMDAEETQGTHEANLLKLELLPGCFLKIFHQSWKQN